MLTSNILFVPVVQFRIPRQEVIKKRRRVRIISTLMRTVLTGEYGRGRRNIAKVRDLQDFYRPVVKKFDDKVPPFLSSTSWSAIQAEISIINDEIRSKVQPRKNYNISVPGRIKSKSRGIYLDTWHKSYFRHCTF